MIKFADTEIQGYRGTKIPLTLVSPDQRNENHLAIVFPGAGYTCGIPLLYYTTELCLFKKQIPVLQAGMNYLKCKE